MFTYEIEKLKIQSYTYAPTIKNRRNKNEKKNETIEWRVFFELKKC